MSLVFIEKHAIDLSYAVGAAGIEDVVGTGADVLLAMSTVTNECECELT